MGRQKYPFAPLGRHPAAKSEPSAQELGAGSSPLPPDPRTIEVVDQSMLETADNYTAYDGVPEWKEEIIRH